MEIRYGAHPNDVKHYDTQKLREHFLAENMMVPDQISAVYSHYDRVIAGGAVPINNPLTLQTYEALKAQYFLERREIGILNVGEAGTVTVDGQSFTLKHKECLYVGKGSKEVVFASNHADQPAQYYFVSTPAHTQFPITHFAQEDAQPMDLGTLENANQRTVYKYIHEKGIKSCQLVMGLTELKTGSIWNTMPSHVHDRRMEVYFYFKVAEDARVFHFMGEPTQTRHLLVGNHQAVISPPWSIHSGAGTSNYSFIWAMGGENYDYTDMDLLKTENLR